MDFGDQIMNKLKKPSRPTIKYGPRFKNTFFYLKKTERYEFLKARLNQNKSYFKEILQSDFKPVNYQSDKPFLTFGSILVDESNNIFIYNNDDESNDTLIRLNLDYYKRYSLFNGQIVAIRGKNVGNNELIVQGIHCLPSIDASGSIENLKCHIKIIHRITAVTDFKADVVIFIGCNVPDFKKTESSPHYIHIPTMEDLDCIEVYPMNFKQTNNASYTGLNNPCEFTINTKKFSVNTLPVIDLLSNIEICKNEQVPQNDICGNLLFSEGTIFRLCHHLIFQRSYLPVMNINKVSYDIKSLTMNVAPDFYIIRSEKFDPFCRDIGPTKIINIGMEYNWDIYINGNETKLNLIK